MLSRLRHSTLYRQALGLVLLAFVLQAFLPLFHTPAAANAANFLHICSTNSPISQGHENKSAPQKTPDCPICQAAHFAGGGFPLPQDSQPLSYLYVAVSLAAIAQENIHGHVVIESAQPRAPPILV